MLALGIKPSFTTKYVLDTYGKDIEGSENIGNRPVNAEKLIAASLPVEVEGLMSPEIQRLFISVNHIAEIVADRILYHVRQHERRMGDVPEAEGFEGMEYAAGGRGWTGLYVQL